MTDNTAAALDAADPLAQARAAFQLPDCAAYFAGNSLGARPTVTAAVLSTALEQGWGDAAVGGWNSERWIDLPQRIAGQLAGLIGAQAAEVAVADSTSINLYKVLNAALTLRPDRRVILSEPDNFPTDLYVAQGVTQSACADHATLKIVPPDAIEAALNDDVAVLMLSHVNYRTGARHDMARLTQAAHAAGALVIWDLAHSTGAVPVDLNAARADFAVGCGYKYLNGGPGAPAFAYAAQRHHTQLRSPIWGWFGHAQPFAFDPDFAPAAGAQQLYVGTPPVLSMLALEAALETFLRFDAAAIETKRAQMLAFVSARARDSLLPRGFEILTPATADAQGSQLSLRHPDGWPMVRALAARGIVGDFRAPDVLRFGFAPLYNAYAQLQLLIDTLVELTDSGAWDQPQFHQKQAVT